MLRRVAEEGLRERYGDPVPAEARERLEFELGVIGEMGFPSYFLIVWDFVKYAKENGIAVGPGRGSAAGSIVSYSLGITDIDPIEHDLFFERFLNPGRKSMPDIDIDFSVRGRDRMIQYVTEKYGSDSVAQIITFGTMAPRAAIRDSARVHGFDYKLGDQLAKQIPEPIMGRSPSFEECLRPGEELQQTYETDADARKVIDTARGLEGKIRNTSIHAAAVVISGRPLKEIVPLQLVEDKSAAAATDENGKPVKTYKTVTQYAMGPVEEMGLLKMDFLGLRNLDVIDDAIDIIQRSRGEEIDIGSDPARRHEDLRDARRRRFGRRLPARVRGHARGDEAGRADRVRRHHRPGLALPARRDGRDPALRPRQGRPDTVTYEDERLKEITEATYGCLVYQEQLMEISKKLAGFTPAESDDLRKAIGKKKRDLMAKMEQKFMEGTAASGTERRVSNSLWASMTAAADYSFNKSHAACYALIAYRTAYLKANYPAEYMAAVISTVMGTKDKVPFFISHCAGHGHQGAAARHQPVRPRLRGHRRRHPLRPRRGQERRPFGRRGDPPCPGGASDHVDLGLLRAGRLAGRQQARDRVPDQMRRLRLAAGLAPGHAGDPARSPGRRGKGAGRCPSRSGLDLRYATTGPGRRCRRRPARTDLGNRVRAEGTAGARKGDPRDLPLLASARRPARGDPGPLRLQPGRARQREDGSWVKVGGIITEYQKMRTERAARWPSPRSATSRPKSS